MFSKCLVDQQTIRFPGLNHGGYPQMGLRKSENMLNSKLPQHISSALFGRQIGQLGNLTANLSISIGLPNSVQNGNDGGSTGFMSINHHGENLLFKMITEKFPKSSIYLSVQVLGFGEINVDGAKTVHRIDWESKFMEVNSGQPVFVKATGRQTIGRSYECVKQIENIPEIIINAWRDRKTFQGTFTVFLIFSQEYLWKLEYKPDLELMTSEKGISFKCHRGRISSENPELAKVLEKNHGKSKLTIMSYLSGASMEAFLKYIYKQDATSVITNTDMAVEVLKAALEFKVESLICKIQEYLCGKASEEIGVDGVLKLFRIVKSSLHGTRCEDSDSDDDGSDTSSDESDSSDSSVDLDDQLMEEDGLKAELNGDGLEADVKGNDCRKLLEQKAEEMMRWCLKTQPDAVLQSNEYKKLVACPNLVRDLARFIPQA